MPEEEAMYKIEVIHSGSNNINCCLNSLWEMSGCIYGEQRDTMKKPLTAPVVSAVYVVWGVLI